VRRGRASLPALARARRGGVRSGGGDRGVRRARRRGPRAGTMGRRPGVVQPGTPTRRGRERRTARRPAGAAAGRAGTEATRSRRGRRVPAAGTRALRGRRPGGRDGGRAERAGTAGCAAWAQRAPRDARLELSIRLNLAELDLEAGRLLEAEAELRRAEQVAIGGHVIRRLAQIYTLMGRLRGAQGD